MAALQAELDAFQRYYNEVRPHRACGRQTPLFAFSARTKAGPSGRPVRDAGEFRIRHDRVDQTGKVTLRYAGKRRHLGIGRGLKGTKVMLLVDDRSVRVLDAEGEFLARFEIDPRLTYQAKV